MRTTKGAARNQAKKRLFKKTKGFRGGNRRLLRTAKESLVRAGVYAFRDRRVRERLFRELWIIRLNAAVRMRDLRMASSFMGCTSRVSSWIVRPSRKWRFTIRPALTRLWLASKTRWPSCHAA